ncbi:FYN-binding protein 1-like isoform X1 [Oncorhynchus mykiss]|uniref:FYN-binding protein 1-like isoform X1 n=2 Tax=Oncorhynchus mykiss TaxID=8022 RepID=UPI0018776C23|nr:FYN-binding protein 1-like isoform X1 [Oncorhynchus mykiss]
MGESVDVCALRARFHAKADMAGSRDSTSPKPPLRGFGRGGPRLADVSVTANGGVRNKLMLMVPTPPLPGSSYSPDLQRLPPQHVRAELEGMSTSPEPHSVFHHLPPSHRPHRAAKELPLPASPPTNIDQQGRVRVTGELLQNMMLKHKGVHPGPTKPTPPSLPSQRTLTGVTPLRRALPPEAPSPIKPRRPPHINLQAHQRSTRALHLAGQPGLRKTDGGSSQSLPGLVSLSGPPRLPTKPSSLPRQCTPVHFEDDQGEYDDVGLDVKPPPPPLNHPGSWDKSDSWNDNSSSRVDEGSDGSDVYKGNEQEVKNTSSDKKKQKELRWQQEQEKRNQKKRLERDNKYRKKFKLGTGDIDVLHMGRVRHDWQGGKHDLSVRQGNRVEIIRVKNNPDGRWLARTQTGTYGYIISTCVDVDYEEVKRKLKLSRAPDPSLPPPPPPVRSEDNDIYYDVDSSGNMNSLDPVMREMLEKDEKEFRKKFKFEGPILVLHSMMVDLNASIKKTGGTALAVVQGEILEVIQVTSDKKALCRNKQGKYGYVPRVLLQAEGDDVYDDVDHITDIYDNDNVYNDTIH